MKHRPTSKPSVPAPESRTVASAPAPTSTATDRTPLFAALLVALTFLAYLPVWHAGFVWDDTIFLTQNPLILHPHGLFKFWFTTEAPDYFPMTSSLLWFEWRFWGNHPLGYHLVNLALHAASAVVWWRVLARLRMPGAWLAAALFALHPVNAESVVWITERKNTLAMFFAALAVLSYLHFEDTQRRRFYGLAALSFTLGLLSKTAVAPLPMALLGIAWWRRGKIAIADVKRTLPFFGITLVLAIVTVWFQYHRAIGEAVVREGGLASRIAGAGWAVWFYLFKALLPVNLIPVYPRWQINPANPLVYLPALLLAATLVLLWFKRAPWGRAGFAALAFFAVMLSPVLGFLDISYMRYSLVADRWQYFALLGPLTLLAAGLTHLSERRAPVRPAPALVAGVLLVALGVLTWNHARVYASNEMLWQTTTDRNPNSFLAENNFGNVLMNRGDLDGAITHFQKGLQLEANNPEGLSNLGVAFARKHQDADAIAQFRRALDGQPDCVLALNNLRIMLLPLGQTDEIITRSRQALDARPNDAEVHYNLAVALVQKGLLNDGLAALQKTLALQPTHVPARNSLAELALQQGKIDDAIAQFREVLQSRPDLAEAHGGLGLALLQKNQVDEAIAQFEQAIALRPDLVEVRANLGAALRRKGRVDEAIAQFRKAIELRPDSAVAHNNLGNALLQKGEGREAVAHYLKYVELRPNDVEAHRSLAWTLATSADPSVRNGTNAVAVAQRGNQLTGGTNAIMLGTLAAAYAEAGRFPDAIATIQQALQIAKAANNAGFVTTFEAHQAKYQAGQSLRGTSPNQ